MTSEAHVQTSTPQRYVKRLCKHFAHEIEASYDEEGGRAAFSFGTCIIKTDPERLVLRAEAENEEALRKVEGVIARHLRMFAKGREEHDLR